MPNYGLIIDHWDHFVNVPEFFVKPPIGKTGPSAGRYAGEAQSTGHLAVENELIGKLGPMVGVYNPGRSIGAYEDEW